MRLQSVEGSSVTIAVILDLESQALNDLGECAFVLNYCVKALEG